MCPSRISLSVSSLFVVGCRVRLGSAGLSGVHAAPPAVLSRWSLASVLSTGCPGHPRNNCIAVVIALYQLRVPCHSLLQIILSGSPACHFCCTSFGRIAPLLFWAVITSRLCQWPQVYLLYTFWISLKILLSVPFLGTGTKMFSPCTADWCLGQGRGRCICLFSHLEPVWSEVLYWSQRWEILNFELAHIFCSLA